MFGSIGIPELLFIFVIALLIFGPKRLPEVGRTLGKTMRDFRRATNDFRFSVESEMRLDEPPPAAAAPSRAATDAEPRADAPAPAESEKPQT